MLEDIRKNIEKLIALYEAEKTEKENLRTALDKAVAERDAFRKQITELENQIDTLKLAEAFMAPAGSDSGAKLKIDGLIREIDKCIKLLEN